jgi:hypothetical protein
MLMSSRGRIRPLIIMASIEKWHRIHPYEFCVVPEREKSMSVFLLSRVSSSYAMLVTIIFCGS